MESQLDINVARIAHITLAMQLEAMIRGEISPHQHIPTLTHCDLGLWLARREAVSVQHDTYHTLVHHHEQFHQTANHIVAHLTEAIGSASTPKVAGEMAQMQFLSREIVFLLTSMELAHLDAQQRSEWLAHPLKSLARRLFAEEEPLLSGEGDILDVSHARLLHLRWLEGMFHAFRSHHRHIVLNTEESCLLGEWIRKVGLPKWGHLGEMTALDEAHQWFHTQGENIIKYLKTRQNAQADQAYAMMQTDSREILYLLSLLESRLLDDASIRHTKHFIW
ncbi:MAG: CZB domain-containing protein [Magnetococcus sp. XQGC-1]